MKPQSLLLMTILLVTSVGCDPIFRMRGSVTEMPTQDKSSGDGSVHDGGAPIAGVQLSPYCSEDGQMSQFDHTVESDADGKFETTYIGLLSLDCELRAEKQDYQTVSVPVRSACTERRDDKHCTSAEFDIELAPQDPDQ